ncbi:hypothetical protein [Myxosarcina sp. GI1(2024)]
MTNQTIATKDQDNISIVKVVYATKFREGFNGRNNNQGLKVEDTSTRFTYWINNYNQNNPIKRFDYLRIDAKGKFQKISFESANSDW